MTRKKNASELARELQDKLEEMSEEVGELHPESDLTFRNITEEMSFDDYE